jgi:hypothetical protein
MAINLNHESPKLKLYCSGISSIQTSMHTNRPGFSITLHDVDLGYIVEELVSLYGEEEVIKWIKQK